MTGRHARHRIDKRPRMLVLGAGRGVFAVFLDGKRLFDLAIDLRVSAST